GNCRTIRGGIAPSESGAANIGRTGCSSGCSFGKRGNCRTIRGGIGTDGDTRGGVVVPIFSEARGGAGTAGAEGGAACNATEHPARRARHSLGSSTVILSSYFEEGWQVE